MSRNTAPMIITHRSGTLFRRQCQMLLRKPQSFFLLWFALLCICYGYTVAYNTLAKQLYYPDEMYLVTQQILHYYRQLSLLTIVLIVPVIGVNAISSEREMNTLDLILTTALTPLEFIFSKIAASFTVVLVAILGTLPILGITATLGGVGPNEILALSFMQIVLASVSLAVGLAMGAKMPSFILSLLSSYGILLIFLLPTYLMPSFGTANENAARMFPGLAASLFAAFALLNCIPHYLSQELNRVRRISWRPLNLKGKDTQLWTFLGVRDYGEPIPENKNPVYVAERERFLSYMVKRHFDAPSILWIIATLFTLVALYPRSMILPASLVILIFIPPVAATALASEYQHKSWESLRATLISTRQIILGKLRLATSQGMIHLVAFYAPPLLIIAIVWIIFSVFGVRDAYKFSQWSILQTWGGHLLVIFLMSLTSLLLSTLSLWISTFFHRTFPALMISYLISAFFLFGPQFLKLIHPRPGYTLGGVDEQDFVSIVLTIFHMDFIFRLWPQSDKLSQIHVIPFTFWKYYFAHAFLLCVLAGIFYILVHRRIRQGVE